MKCQNYDRRFPAHVPTKTQVMMAMCVLVLGLCLVGILSSEDGYSADPESFTDGGFEYHVISETDMTAMVYKYTGTEAVVIIPSTVAHGASTYDVIALYGDAFSVCTWVTAITVPASITDLGMYTFSGCVNLATLNLGDCTAPLYNLQFVGCYKLIEFTTSDSNTAYSTKDGVLFDKDGDTLILFPHGRTGEYTTPDGVTAIGSGAFRECIGLTTIVIESDVRSIGSFAFRDCPALSSVTIKKGAESIGKAAFQGTDITYVDIPDSVTTLGTSVFAGCFKLKWVTIGKGITDISNHMFTECTSMIHIDIPNNIKSIKDSAFSDCKRLRSIELPDSVQTIEDYAFRSCIGLVTVTIGKGITEIGRGAFEKCSELMNITFGSMPTNIGTEIFRNCNGLLSVRIDAGSIPERMFAGITANSVALGENVTRICEGAFANCPFLSQVSFRGGTGVILDGDSTGPFKGCPKELTLKGNRPGYNLMAYSEIESSLRINGRDLSDGWAGALRFEWTKIPDAESNDESSLGFNIGLAAIACTVAIFAILACVRHRD